MAIEVSKNIYFIGSFDSKIRTFDIIMKTANGSSYNAYLIKGSEGVAIFDTVKAEYSEDFFKKVEELCSYDEIKYIVMHHLEPDHSGALKELMSRSKNAKLIISLQAQIIINNLFKEGIEFEVVMDNKIISLGDKTIEFIMTPYLHWPDTMSSYIKEDKILFSGDVFGCHFCDERIFDDMVGDFDFAFKYYYDKIMRPFKRFMVSALQKYQKFEIETIAPLHGPIIRSNPKKYISLYEKWTNKDKFTKTEYGYKMINIFYISSYGNTESIAKEIYKGADSVVGIRASIYDLASLEIENMIDLLEESDGIIIGSPTINSDAVKPAWDLLSSMAFLEKTGKVGASFGSFGWTGEAPAMLHQRMQSLKFRTPLEPFKIKLSPTESELTDAKLFGIEFAEIVNGKMVEITL